MAYETPLTIAEVMRDISNNKYVLPSIQREYVWDTEQIETLFDSLMQDYPIGAFLFWEIEKSRLQDYDFYEFLRNYHEKNNTHNKKVDLKGSDGVTAVLDGQQRLTSIYIGLKGSYAYRLKYKQKKSESAYPVRYLYLNLIEDAQDETNRYDFRFLTDKEFKGMSGGYWYRVGDILNMTQPGETSQYVLDQIAFAGTFTKEQTMHANNTLQKLYNVVHTDKTLSYYKEKAVELDKVLNIFIRVNSGGTVLTYSDLLLSIASAQWENHDAREEITDFVDDVNSIGGGFRINKDFVLKTALVLTDFPNIAFKVDNFNKPNMMKIEANWENIKRAIKQAVNLVSSFGFTGETLSSNNALIPIAYYLHTIGMPDNFVESGANKRDVTSYDLAIVELNERIARIDDESGKLHDANDDIRSFGLDYNAMSEAQQYALGSYVNLMSSSTQLLVNPILGLLPKYTEEDFEEFASKETDENKAKWYSDYKLLIVSLANFLYKIELNERDKKLLWKSLRKNKRMLKSLGISKKEFGVEIIDAVIEALNYKYTLGVA